MRRTNREAGKQAIGLPHTNALHAELKAVHLKLQMKKIILVFFVFVFLLLEHRKIRIPGRDGWIIFKTNSIFNRINQICVFSFFPQQRLNLIIPQLVAGVFPGLLLKQQTWEKASVLNFQLPPYAASHFFDYIQVKEVLLFISLPHH